ncbi:MAG: molybdopterin biosynthesis protein [Nitrospirae bacterium]|nr:molybdopterin biosynthesis protein [Nitrospirota bacterium]
MKRKVYLESTPLDKALGLWHERLGKEGLNAPLPAERVRVIDALGRVSAEAAVAKVSSPFFHSAAMDGYAVKFAETFGASEKYPKRLRIGLQAFPVDTGDPLPEGCNAVIMIEEVNVVRAEGEESDCIEIIEPSTPWQHVRTIGEDIVSTELIIPENQRIGPVDIGALLAGGHTEIAVRRRPRVLIIPTGDEIVEPGTELKVGSIIEYNSRVLGGLVSEWGGEPLRSGIVPDDRARLRDALVEACSIADVVVVNAGSSAGSEDFSEQVIGETGEVVLHGVAIKPGKPVILGIVGGKPVLGIPGYPVSAYIAFSLFAKPLVHALQGLDVKAPETLRATLSRQIASSLGEEEFVRVKVGMVGDRKIATPMSRGAGVIMSLVRADGILRIPSASEGAGAGSEVEIELLKSEDELRNTIVCIGSHDNALDVLANVLKKRYPRLSLSSAHVGSMGGLIALKKGEAHLAGTHLLDEETGLYNVPFIRKLLPERRVVLVNLVYREQGLVVKKGNPKGIRGFKDLTRGDVTFINRQSGSGTRLLTDAHLRDLGIVPGEISGYAREEYTHMGVASAVLTGIADTGLAILASARALDLDFIPVAKERYDIAIPGEYVECEMIKALLKIIREDEEFRNTVAGLGGYDTGDMGKIMYEG